ncbi:sulfurtransferase [Subtercola lobariae]|uniref:Sulfurtransferase n=1 Tax=Subtercola lobariae TaxID=1588641 RepID=A0A917EVJ0_9MICO|nr:sulfurtransferase [Subtercola lobariae]GGF12303.1 sulfurtransferase [Subtercola lobariae]
MPILITAEELKSLIESPETVRVLDVRWRLGGPEGYPEYRAGHIPTAVYVDLETELARHGEPHEGRHPLPDAADLQAAARRWGLNDGETVVVYDDLKNLSAARAWWLLTNAGVADVRLLDGSLRAWKEAGYDVAAGEAEGEPGTVTLAYSAEISLSIEEAAAFPETGVLLDARAPERFRGDEEPIDPVAGHIPGARNAPATANFDSSGRFLSAEQLRAQFEAIGVSEDRPVAVYCGSGVSAAADAVALTIAGFDPALYAGSWSAWSNSPGRPVATGD